MSIASSTIVRRAVCFGACLVVASLILVPTLVRAGQHFDPRDPIRPSVRLNWNGDAPPTKADVGARDTTHDVAVVPPVNTGEPDRAGAARRASPLDELLPIPPLDNTPSALRGPPAARLA